MAGTGHSSSSLRANPQKAARTAHFNSPLVQQLARDLAGASGVTSWLYWMEGIERAQPSDFAELLELAGDNKAVLQLIGTRWADLNPKELFNFVSKPNCKSIWRVELEPILFREWSQQDLSGFIAMIDTAPFGSKMARADAADYVMRVNPEEGLRVLARWDIGMFGPSTSGVRKWADADPQHAAEFTMQTCQGYGAKEVMTAIGDEWGNLDPRAAASFAATHTDLLSKKLGDAALARWAGQNLDEAAEWLAGTDEKTRNRFAGPVVQEWAKQDPATALSWAEANLSGPGLAQAASAALAGAADKDVAAAARLVEAMAPSNARAEGAVAVASKWFPQFLSSEPPRPEAIQWLENLDDESIANVLRHTYFSWVDTDPKGLVQFISRHPSQYIAEEVYSSLGRSFARSDPLGALNWASSLPGAAAQFTGYWAFGSWVDSQPAQAGEWLNQLSAEDPRRGEYLKSALFHIAYEHDPRDRFSAMGLNDLSAARIALEQADLPDDKRAPLLQWINEAASR